MKKKYLEGIIYTILASLWWGIIGVIYFKFASFANPIELTVHRTIWTAVLLIVTTSVFSKWNEFFLIIKKKTNIIILFITGTLIMINWFTWIYAVSVNKLLDSSLGYYIFPIFSVFFGIIFLKEKYNKKKIFSIILVFISILYLIIYYKTFPWIGLTVAISFSLYTLIRKKINISPDIGLMIETLLLTPFTIIAFICRYYLFDGRNSWHDEWHSIYVADPSITNKLTLQRFYGDKGDSFLTEFFITP